MKISAIRKKEAQCDVFNFGVKGKHKNYFAEGVLVHNCYQGSTKDAPHGDFGYIKQVIDSAQDAEVFELALGGGEPSEHPNFTEILEYANDAGVTANFTAYGLGWVDKIPNGFRNAVGMSVHKPSDLKKIKTARQKIDERNKSVDDWYQRVHPTIVAQTVVGAVPKGVIFDTVKEAADSRIPILLLGFKTTGRAAGMKPDVHEEELRKALAFAKETVQAKDDEEQYGDVWGFYLGVDTAFLDSYSHLLDELEIPYILRTSPEGKFSMYVDAVKQEVGPSSYSPDNMVPATDDMFTVQFAGW